MELHDVPYTSRYDTDIELPKFEMPKDGCNAKVVYQLLHDELLLGALLAFHGHRRYLISRRDAEAQMVSRR